MSRGLLKKEGVAQACLARYLLGEHCGNRLKTIEELSSDYGLSVGLVQFALKNWRVLARFTWNGGGAMAAIWSVWITKRC
ncbi:hypothetical protein TI10_03970 [Photorhabdus luminescens subsp. luminescens]|nr:hypothetical protein TI10_03970 [Photorhabdus luminescens subsp. luminescens]